MGHWSDHEAKQGNLNVFLRAIVVATLVMTGIGNVAAQEAPLLQYAAGQCMPFGSPVPDSAMGLMRDYVTVQEDPRETVCQIIDGPGLDCQVSEGAHVSAAMDCVLGDDRPTCDSEACEDVRCLSDTPVQSPHDNIQCIRITCSGCEPQPLPCVAEPCTVDLCDLEAWLCPGGPTPCAIGCGESCSIWSSVTIESVLDCATLVGAIQECPTGTHFDPADRSCVGNGSGVAHYWNPAYDDDTRCGAASVITGQPKICSTAWGSGASPGWAHCLASGQVDDPSRWLSDCGRFSYGGRGGALDWIGTVQAYPVKDSNGNLHGEPVFCDFQPDSWQVLGHYPLGSWWECSTPTHDHYAWHSPVTDGVSPHAAQSITQINAPTNILATLDPPEASVTSDVVTVILWYA